MTIGNFDGVHLGHQAILKKVVGAAKKVKGTAVVYTLSPHPAKVMAPSVNIKLIETDEQKTARIKAQGVDLVVVESFTKVLAHLAPEEFFKKIILKRFRPKKMIIGYDLTFGRRRTGSVEMLEKLCHAEGIEIEVVEPVFLREVLVSSTQVRLYLSGGFIEDANALLGHPYAMTGKVVRGKGIGGEMGIHTANIKPDNDILLPAGVYITRTLGHTSVTNVGCNPTFAGESLTIETHILNFKKRIYGRKIEVEFFKKIRDEIQFAGPHELREQIDRDILQAKQFFKGKRYAKKRR